MAHPLFELELEFLTPAFIGGSDPKKRAEFRIPELKAGMRYWWRQSQSWENTSDLYKKESLLFGNTDRASLFTVQVSGRKLHFAGEGEGAYLPDNRNAGRSYLFFSCRSQSNNQPGRQRWIQEGGKVQFVLRFRGISKRCIREALLALWLLQSFGGLGLRSRRGGGSFCIHIRDATDSWVDEIKRLFDCSATEFFENRTEDLAIKPYGDLFDPSSPIITAFAAPAPEQRFKQTQPLNNSNEVLDKIGSCMRDYRSVYKRGGAAFRNDAVSLHRYCVVEGGYSGNDPLPKHAFGLPIIYNFKRRGGGFENNFIEAVPGGDGHDRRASPLFISIKRTAKNPVQYYANLLILWGAFLPAGEKIKLNVKERGSSGVIVKSTAVNIPANDQPLVNFLRTVP